MGSRGRLSRGARVNRRAFLLAPFLVPAQAAPSVHLRGTLTPADSGGLKGYYALCEGDVCNAIETLGISVHPKNPIFADDLRIDSEGVAQRIQKPLSAIDCQGNQILGP